MAIFNSYVKLPEGTYLLQNTTPKGRKTKSGLPCGPLRAETWRVGPPSGGSGSVFGTRSRASGTHHLVAVGFFCWEDRKKWIGFHLVMTNSSPWKDPPCLRTVNHLFLWAIYTMAMLNNQRVKGTSTGNHRFSHELWRFPVKMFPEKPVDTSRHHGSDRQAAAASTGRVWVRDILILKEHCEHSST